MKKNRQRKDNELTAQEKYVKSLRQYKSRVSVYRLLIFLCFTGLWEIAADLGWIDFFFFSSPSRIVSCLVDLTLHRSLLLHTGITLFETLISFLLVILAGMTCATILWYSKTASEVLEPYLVVLNSLPKSALAPLFIVWLGTGTTTIIVAGISVALFGAIISLYTSFKQVDPEMITLIYTLGGNKRDAFVKAVLPGSIPTVLSTMKVNIGLALVGVIIGEFLAARRGLGYLIIYGSQVFQMHMVITSILILCIIAMGLYLLIQFAEQRYLKKTSKK